MTPTIITTYFMPTAGDSPRYDGGASGPPGLLKGSHRGLPRGRGGRVKPNRKLWTACDGHGVARGENLLPATVPSMTGTPHGTRPDAARGLR